MKPLFYSFRMFVLQIFKDNMLIVVCIAPVLAAFFFNFGIPFIEELLCRYLNQASVLFDYYILFDMILGFLAPYTICFASSMVILTEYDENMINYIAVTPVGKKGYLISRLVFPALVSFFISIILMLFFTLSYWEFPVIILTCFLTCTLSISISLMLVSFSHNKVEGMALAKLSSFNMIGLFIPFFLFTDIQYIFSFLPSFWIAKFCLEQSCLFFIPAVITCFIWIQVFYINFNKKLT